MFSNLYTNTYYDAITFEVRGMVEYFRSKT